jgi:hypothetical protein
MPILPVGRRFNPWDPEIASFIEWVTATELVTWRSYLVILGLHAHLSRYVTSSPFIRGTHLDTRIIQLIHKFAPDLNAIERVSFRGAVQTFVHDMKLIGKEFDYREPPPRDAK